MKTQLMRKDPLPLMEHAFEIAPATATAAAEHTEPRNLKLAVGLDFWQETGIFAF